jgi:cytochrome c-type biogenesis protein CcmF
MELGTILLILAALFCALDIGFLLLSRRIKLRDRLGKVLALGSAGSVWGSLLLLLTYIFDNNFSYKYVMEHSSINLSVDLKLSTLWAGQEGSLLLWTALIFLFYVLFKQLFYKSVEDKLVRRSFTAAAILCFTFIIISIISDPFAVTGEIVQDGWGLNPLLRTFWNVVHPPIVFIGYAATIVPASIAISRMTQRNISKDISLHKKIDVFVDLQMALTWTFLTLGIILGGYWAYITLGWGGYWAWDPVETTSLIVWLFCTAYFHGKGLLDRRSIGSNALIFLTYLSTIFATFITRSGILSSVHGFAESPVIQIFIILIFGSLFTLLTALGYQISSRHVSLERLLKKIKGSAMMHGLFGSLICILGLIVVSFVGILYPTILSAITGNQYGIEPSFFNRFSAPFAIGLMISIFFCTFPNPKRSRTLIKIICIGIGLGVVFLFIGFPTNSSTANISLPLAVLALLISGVRFIKDFLRISKASTLLRSSSHTILHLGLVLILIGTLVSSNIQTSAEGWYHINSSIDLGKVSIEMDEIMFDEYTGPNSYSIRGRISIYEGGILTGGGYAYHGSEPGWGTYCGLLIVSNIVRDVYISMHNIRMDPVTGVINQAYLEVKVIEYVSLVWAGCLITLIAISTLLMSYITRIIKHKSL